MMSVGLRVSVFALLLGACGDSGKDCADLMRCLDSCQNGQICSRACLAKAPQSAVDRLTPLYDCAVSACTNSAAPAGEGCSGPDDTSQPCWLCSTQRGRFDPQCSSQLAACD
jgi:hypothetical protein